MGFFSGIFSTPFLHFRNIYLFTAITTSHSDKNFMVIFSVILHFALMDYVCFLLYLWTFISFYWKIFHLEHSFYVPSKIHWSFYVLGELSNPLFQQHMYYCAVTYLLLREGGSIFPSFKTPNWVMQYQRISLKHMYIQATLNGRGT